MKNQCFIDILLRTPAGYKSLKIDESQNDFQMTINLGSLEKIQIHDGNVLYLQYTSGFVRLDIDCKAFYDFILTELKNISGTNYEFEYRKNEKVDY